MSRLVDRGAIVAAWVGVGMAVTIGISFLLVIPIEPFYWLLAMPSGLLIGYYANQRAGRRRGEWRRIVGNALLAGAVTAAAFALLLLGVKALFFLADNGYRDRGASLACRPGADCVYQRYVAEGQGPALQAVGVTDAESFGRFYWSQQLATAGALLVITTVGGLGGGVLFGLGRPTSPQPDR